MWQISQEVYSRGGSPGTVERVSPGHFCTEVTRVFFFCGCSQIRANLLQQFQHQSKCKSTDFSKQTNNSKFCRNLKHISFFTTASRSTFHSLQLQVEAHFILYNCKSKHISFFTTASRSTFHSLQLQIEAHFILYNCKSKHISFFTTASEAHFILYNCIRSTFHFLYQCLKHISFFFHLGFHKTSSREEVYHILTPSSRDHSVPRTL
jgi:hypothetical protein